MSAFDLDLDNYRNQGFFNQNNLPSFNLVEHYDPEFQVQALPEDDADPKTVCH